MSEERRRARALLHRQGKLGNDAATTATSPVEEKPQATQETGYNALQNLYDSMTVDPRLDEKELKKRRRVEQAEKTIAALGDIGNAVANIWGASKGATPNQVANQGATLSGVYKDKWDKWREDYLKRLDEHVTAKDKAIRNAMSATRLAQNDARIRQADAREARLAQKQEDEVDLRVKKQQLAEDIQEWKESQGELENARKNNESEAKINEIKQRIAKSKRDMQKTDAEIKLLQAKLGGTTVEVTRQGIDELTGQPTTSTETRTTSYGGSTPAEPKEEKPAGEPKKKRSSGLNIGKS